MESRKKRQNNFLELSLSPNSFSRTISYREFLTCTATALLLTSIRKISIYYSSEDWVSDNSVGIGLWSITCVLLLNHILYRREHRRSNNLVGRLILDFLFIICCVVVAYTDDILFGRGVQSSSLSNPGVFAGIFFLMLFEIALGVLKRILRVVRWQIF